MSNSYTLYSAEITNITDEEADWWKENARSFDHLDEPEYEEKRIKLGLDEEDTEGFPEFEWKYDPKHESIWIYAEEGGNLENIALIVQRFLAEFRPKDVWGMEYAFTCSKPRLGEFGGGAMVVTAMDCHWTNTGTWMRQKIKELKQK